ncbi:uncharacterized protein EDB91DRAFT_1200042 [Suillus paluster]|uniref:uncharacterized protein n=1 Tax=Suillus paluster TaxID=48578 RepID=UPI001B887234|nr:uncharacterized protein EDB91DRAFT_1200042 [Suillus paluster]KAG1745077.1 hypothetical protein EDB91DRAFT_1200042 [Suillus paluster]
MSGASSFSTHSPRSLKEASVDSAPLQSANSDEQAPPENDAAGPTKEEKENCEASAVKEPPGISNTPSRPSEPQQESTSKVSPDGDLLALEAEKVVGQTEQPNLSDVVNVMERVLGVLQDSTIAFKGGKDDRSRFWGIYKRIAEEHDGEFLERYNGDMDIMLVFSGLFSAVTTSFIVAMEYKLSPDPSDTTNALLTQLVQIGLGNLAAAGSTPVAPASTFSPTTSDIRIQSIAYASLCMSLLAAFGAVLGKQWLGYYKSNRYGRGSQEERGKRRQEKFDGIITWYFDAVVQSFPILLQISLLLFGIALSANMGRHFNNGLRIFVLFLDCNGIIDITRVSISDADIDDFAHTAHRQSSTPNGQISPQIFPAADDVGTQCAATAT